ncbi:MAG: M15 family metallopeptidase [Ruminococcus sp.]|nr:M15 family metallopeptidase [Ruminococcus sp.]
MTTVKKKKRSGGCVGAIILTAIIFAAGVGFEKAFEGLEKLPEYGSETAVNVTVQTAKVPENHLLILVNGNNKIPDDYETELTELSNGEKVSSEIYPDLQKMFDDMREAGIYPVVGEGYRTREKQQEIMEDKIRAFENEGHSQKRAEKMAREWVAIPGTSEHELGLAVDINADKERSDNQEVYDWLYQNAYKYGFILRYPIGKTKITGIDYEPWHYRYVGREYSEEIMNSGLCLEEWLEQNYNNS